MEKNMIPEVKFAKNVMLIDAALLNREAANMRRAMSWGLKRELPLLDMVQWLVCAALDGDSLSYGSDVQVILVHESPETKLSVAAQPEFVKCDGMSFMAPNVGEFQISCVHPAGFTDTCSLFFDLMHILIDNKDVENLMLLPSNELYGTSVRDELHKIIGEKGAETVRKVCLFNVHGSDTEEPYRQQVTAMSLAHVFGITPDDVQ